MPDDERPLLARRSARAVTGRLSAFLGAADPLPIDPDLDAGDPRNPSPDHRPHAARPPRDPRVLALVFVGGCIGTLGRYAAERAWPPGPGHFPTVTFAVNTSGAFALGVVLTALLEHPRPRAPLLRPLLATGVLGGWTTYSSLVVEGITLAKGGRPATAAGYVAVTLVCGLTAVAAGIAIGRRRRPARRRPAGGGSGGPTRREAAR